MKSFDLSAEIEDEIMTAQFKPMLAATIKDVATDVKFPCYASPKMDGIRCVIINGVAMSRTLKPIPNRFVQSALCANDDLEGLDGELIVGDVTAKNCYNVTSSGVMSRDGEPNFKFCVFDRADSDQPYSRRYAYVTNAVTMSHIHGGDPRAVLTPQTLIENVAELVTFEQECLAAGFEGVMVRSIDGPYKHGRTTLREGTLSKLKRFTDGEAIIIGFEEQMHNENEATKDELGHTKRSTVKENMVGAGCLGACLVRDVKTQMEFSVGTGFNQTLRDHIWVNQSDYMGKILKYKHFEIGVKELPRFPVFIGFRDPIDM